MVFPTQTLTPFYNKIMNPAIVALVIGLVEEAIKDYPTIAADLSAIFSKPNPTPDDWAALRAKVQSEDFARLAPSAAANQP